MTRIPTALSRLLAGLTALVLASTAGAHSGHAPTEVHSHLGSPAMWLLLGAGVLGLTAVALIARRLWRRRQQDAKQARHNSNA